MVKLPPTQMPFEASPEQVTALGVTSDAGGSAAEVRLSYPDALVGCSASALMPRPYGVRGGYLAAFGDAVLESSWTAGWDGRPTGTLTEYTSVRGSRSASDRRRTVGPLV